MTTQGTDNCPNNCVDGLIPEIEAEFTDGSKDKLRGLPCSFHFKDSERGKAYMAELERLLNLLRIAP